MPPKKIKPEVEKIEFMNVPLKTGFRYATEDEAINANKVLLWGKYTIPFKKLSENKAKLKAPNRLTRAKELRPDFVLAGVQIKERGAKSSNKEAKAMKKYDPDYDYQIEDLPALDKIYDDIDAKMDAGDDSDELADMQEAVYDNMQRLKGLKKMTGGNITTELVTNSEQYKPPRAIGGKFEKEHGLGTIVQAYFYVYFGENPPDKGRTKYRPATAEEAVNNKMVSLYGMNKIPEDIDRQGKLVGHAGNIKKMNKVQLQTIYAGVRGKRGKIAKDYDLLIFKANNTGNSEQYEKEMNELDEKDYEVAKMQLKILNAINKLEGKPKITKIDRKPLKFEPEPEPEPEPLAIKPKTKAHHKEDNIEIIDNRISSKIVKPMGDYAPKQRETPKHNLDIDVTPTNFIPPKSKEYYIFSNNEETIKIPHSYFDKENRLKTDKASKLRLKNVILHPRHYQEKDLSKFFFEKSGKGIGGSITATRFFNNIGTTLKQGVKDAVDYGSKVIYGVNDYPPLVRNIISKYGNQTISSLMVGRAPVPKAITTALNMVSGGTFQEGMNTQPYDKLFHLFLYVTLNDGTKILFEKNSQINSAVNSKLPPDTETLQIPIPNTTTTVNQFLENGKKQMGNNWIPYDPRSNNCQDFIIGLLTGNRWINPEQRNWIKQDTGALFAKNKYLGKVARGVTDLGGIGERLMNGFGIGKTCIQCICFNEDEWTEETASKWLVKHHFKSIKVDIRDNMLSYQQLETNPQKYKYRIKKMGNGIEFIIGIKK